MSEYYYTDRKQTQPAQPDQPKNGDGRRPEEGQEMFQTKAKDQPTTEIMSGRQDHGPHKRTYRKTDTN